MVVIDKKILNGYEELCYDCKGTGIIEIEFAKNLECVTCNGFGYITWLDNIIKNKNIFIPKGFHFHCLHCGKWLATAKVNIGKRYSISSSLFYSVWKSHDGITCPFCNANMYSHFIKSKNWVKEKIEDD